MILFVCTGNTCRSPMAAALARLRGMDADSAGLSAAPGAPASPGAVRAMAAYGVDLSGHRAKQVNADLIRRADRIYVMSPAHAAHLLSHFPQAAGKTHVLSPVIPDPFGQDDVTYALCAALLISAIENAGLTG